MNNWPTEQIENIKIHAKNIRRNTLRMINHAGSGHPAGSLSIVDALACLYFGVMNYDPNNPNDPNRDILVLSNGHACPALYATMAEAGIIPETELLTLRQFGSRLQGHPERASLPGLETSSGPLGEGLSQAAGMAYALKYLMPQNSRRVYCIISDGELNEGSIAEAGQFACKYSLNNLTVLCDVNGIQLSGKTEDIMPNRNKISIGPNFDHFYVSDGNDIESILEVLTKPATQCAPEQLATESSLGDNPRLIELSTIPGKGVSFMENDYHWHGKAPNDDELERALSELEDK